LVLAQVIVFLVRQAVCPRRAMGVPFFKKI